MRGMLAVILFTLTTAFCWGVYGPVLSNGRADMQGSSLRPFICVGLAYMLIAVLAPLLVLRARGESGKWTMTGIIWSLAAGSAGALGALGIILAFHYGGSPIYVMPLVFGCAPVVNTFYTMYLGRSYKQAGPLFYAGLILVITGAVTVLVFRPSSGHAAAHELQLLPTAASIALTVLTWGVYGPLLHKGQMAMLGSRLRPLICVGLAYFVIAVVLPGLLLAAWQEQGAFTWNGSLWSLAGGATGAIGALGIIMAFNFGGKPVYVMPLVFGLAPVINSFATIIPAGLLHNVSAVFYAGLLLVIAGAVAVLIFAPRAKPHAGPVVPAPDAQPARS